MQYSDATFDWISSNRDAIIQAAQTLGVSPTAIAAFMAKERNAYSHTLDHMVFNPLQDLLYKSHIFTHQAIVNSYQANIASGLVGTKTSPLAKLTNIAMNDLGYANIKLQTAIELIASTPSSKLVELGLIGYVGKYDNLAGDLASDSNHVYAKLTGLLVQQADQFYVGQDQSGVSRVSVAVWNAYSAEIRGQVEGVRS